jgi:hypothetical protein
MRGFTQLKHLGTANDDFTIAPDGELRGIYVGTALATAVVTVYEGTTTSGLVLMTIDAASKSEITFPTPVRATSKSIYIKLTTANAKVTIAYA